jgi:polysaccharide biosynthesis protein PslH
MLKPKIVILLSRFPYPLEKGDKLRAYNQIIGLQHFFEIHLIAISNHDIQQTYLQALEPFVKTITILHQPIWKSYGNAAIGLFGKNPLQVAYYYQNNTLQKLNAIIETIQPQIIYTQLARMAKYVLKFSCKKVLDFQDAFSLNYSRSSKQKNIFFKYLFQLEASRMKLWEKKLVSLFDATTIISAADKNYIADNSIHIIRNGVDHRFFKYANQPKNYDIVFVGNLGYDPNILAVEFIVHQLLPELLKTNATIQILIAGANPSNKIKNYQNKNITIQYWLPDIRDAYAAAKIFVAPLFTGAGLQNKLLEAMSMEMPCITTTVCNAALQANPNVEILIADTVKDVVNQINLLLCNEEKYQLLSKNGRKLVETHFDWQSANINLANLLLSIIK